MRPLYESFEQVSERINGRPIVEKQDTGGCDTLKHLQTMGVAHRNLLFEH